MTTIPKMCSWAYNIEINTKIKMLIILGGQLLMFSYEN